MFIRSTITVASLAVLASSASAGFIGGADTATLLEHGGTLDSQNVVALDSAVDSIWFNLILFDFEGSVLNIASLTPSNGNPFWVSGLSAEFTGLDSINGYIVGVSILATGGGG